MSCNSRPVISIQVGHYANFVGAHFWNSQDLSFSLDKEKNDIDHDVLFREGITLHGNQTTYTPRLVTVDLKGALGSLPEFGDLYNEVGTTIPKTDLSASASQFWNHSVEVSKDETHKRTKYLQQLEADENKSRGEKDICAEDTFKEGVAKHGDAGQDLDDEVKLWSDFLRARFHPKTNVVINDYHHNNAAEPFDIFGYGVQAWQNGSYAINDDFEDRIRFFVEEADSFKGFSMMTDVLNGFGGVSASIADYLKDDYGSHCILSFPVIPNVSHLEKFDANVAANEVLNLALTLKSLAENSSLITPMSLSSDTFRMRRSGDKKFVGFEKLQNHNDYHSSAMLSLALDTFSLPWRLLRGPYLAPFEVASNLNAYGRKIASLDLAAPFPKPIHEKLSTYLKHQTNPGLTSYECDLPQFITLNPHSKSNPPTVWNQMINSRGITGSNSANLDFLEFYSRTMPTTLTNVINSETAVQVGLPFPNHTIGSSFWKPDENIYWDSVGKTMPTLTSWNSNPTSGDIVKVISERARKVKLAKMHRFQDAGLEQDDYDSMIESLTSLSECYNNPTDVI